VIHCSLPANVHPWGMAVTNRVAANGFGQAAEAVVAFSLLAGHVGPVHVVVIPDLLRLAVPDQDELGRLVRHGVGLGNPVGKLALLAHVDPIDGKVRGERPHFPGGPGGNPAGGGVLEDEAQGRQRLVGHRDDRAHVGSRTRSYLRETAEVKTAAAPGAVRKT